MILTEHKGKHTRLARPDFGSYNRNELAIVGGTCDEIRKLAGQLTNAFADQYKFAYVDSKHDDEGVVSEHLTEGVTLELTEHHYFRQLNYTKNFNHFDLRETFAFADMVIVNGNHHQAKAQIVIIDDKKKASLKKRVGQLTDVKMLLLANKQTGVFDFIKKIIPNWQNLPLFHLEETEKIIDFLKHDIEERKPILNGLVLAGGKSQRMGFDKGKVDWHGKEQRYYAADLLKKYCDEVFISCRVDQQSELEQDYAGLPDTFTDLGPYGGILSAFREKPDNAWLVIACDLPLLDEETLDHLVANRNVSTIATAYQSTFNEFPEPLITIWEPKSYPVLLSFLAQGYSCPRKVLINSEVTLLQVTGAEALTNVNNPEDFEKVKKVLNQKTVNNES